MYWSITSILNYFCLKLAKKRRKTHLFLNCSELGVQFNQPSRPHFGIERSPTRNSWCPSKDMPESAPEARPVGNGRGAGILKKRETSNCPKQTTAIRASMHNDTYHIPLKPKIGRKTQYFQFLTLFSPKWISRIFTILYSKTRQNITMKIQHIQYSV